MISVDPLPALAVVIPTLNERVAIGTTLASVQGQLADGISVLVADGGSTDGTQQVAGQSGAHVVQAAVRGRGCQIAEVLSQVQEAIVLVVHADVVLWEGALQRIRQWLADHPSCPGGCLGHRFDSDRRIYRVVELWDRSRARGGMSYGDQAQFFRREWIEQTGGFPNLPIMEDLELSRRLMQLGKPVYLDCPVRVSPRRFERLGWRRTIATNALLRLSYRAGGSRVCQSLYRRYYGRNNTG